MGNKAGERADRRERDSRVRNGLSLVGSLVLSLALFVLPRTAPLIAGVLAVSFFLSLYGAWHCWGFSPRWYKRVALLLLHLTAFVVLGISVWPQIKVTPSSVTFQGIAQETYDFTVRNETESDAYLVRVPFQVSNGMDGLIEPRVVSDEVDSQLPLQEYGYCYGNNGHEYVIAEIPMLPKHQLRRLSLVDSGGKPTAAFAEPVNYVDEQPPHSPTLQTGGISGDYRVCHMIGKVK